jgi:predicted dehydrogenase
MGTGWFTEKCRSGGGALIDIGVHMLDLAWYLLGQPTPVAAFGVAHQQFARILPEGKTCDVDDAAFALIRFEGGKSIELATSWAINQPPAQQGTICRIYGTDAAIEVYTPEGAALYRNFNGKGDCKSNPLRPPKISGHTALARHFRECILGKTKPIIGPAEGVRLMQMIEAIYESSETGRSVAIK